MTLENSSENPLSTAKGSPLFSKNGRFVHRSVLPHLSEAFRIILRSTTELTAAKVAKLYLLVEGSKLKQISNTREKTGELGQILLARCLKSSSHLSLSKGSAVFNEQGEEVGVLSVPCLLSPLMVNDPDAAFGLIYLEGDHSQDAFSLKLVNTVLTFTKMACRLLERCFFYESHPKIVTDFTVSLSLLIENLRFREVQLTNHRLINHMIKISNMINSTLNLNTMLESIMSSAEIIIKAESSSLMLIDDIRNELYFNLVGGDSPGSLKEIRVPMGEGIAGIVAETRKPLLVNDAQNDSRVFKQADEKIDFHTRNILATPMIFQDRLIGVLEVVNSLGREEFSQSDLNLLSTFSDQAALAIQNREMVQSLKDTNQELNKKLGELSTLYEIGKVLTSTLDKKDFFDSAIKILAEEVGLQYTSVLTRDDKDQGFHVISEFGSHKRPDQEELSNMLDGGQSLTDNKLLIPLQQGDKNYGYLYLRGREEGDVSMNVDDIRLITTISNQITKGAENSNLLDEMVKSQAYENELRITSSFQKSLLPKENTENPYYSVGLFSKPAKTMGGDFYDLFECSPQKTVFLIADVSGKSLPAALFMAVTNSIIRTIGKLRNISTTKTLQEANSLIHENSESGMFVTLFYSVYNHATHRFTYSSAGHNDQLLYRSDQKEFESLQCKGSPLGVLPSRSNDDFEMKHIYIKPGDILVFYTDGVVEAIGKKTKDEFGMERLKKVIMDNYFLSPDQMVKRIYSEVESFVGDQEQFDDISIMVVKILN